MTTQQVEHVKGTWSAVMQLDPVVVGGLFYGRLFETAPHLKPMFRSSIAEQSRKLITMIQYVISKLDALDQIIDEIGKLARNHVKYGVKSEHYEVVGSALLWTLQKGLAERWTGEVSEAWEKCYGVLSTAMIRAAEGRS